MTINKSLIAFVSLLPMLAHAAPEVSLQIEAEEQVTRVAEDGSQAKTYVPAEDVKPGDRIRYTLRYRNSGDEAATDVNIDNPIPEGARYLPDSAWGGEQQLFSIDGGETFKRPGSLTWQRQTGDGEREQQTASPEQYDAVRWVVKEIPAGTSGEVGFSVVIE